MQPCTHHGTGRTTEKESTIEPSVAVLGILGALLIGAMSPGPSFVLVARTSIGVSRRDGLAAALGMGVGGLVFGGLAFLGLRAALEQVGWLYAGLKVLGGLYLVYLASVLWRSATHPIDAPASAEPGQRLLRRSFALALATQLSNPKTAVVYASIFAAFLPASLPGWIAAAMLPSIFLVETGWYALVALGLSSGRPRAAYLRWRRGIDRAAGSVMGALGIRLIADMGRRT